MSRETILNELLNCILIAVGVLAAGMGLSGFLAYSNFIDGGITGVSMLLDKTTDLSLSVLLPTVNFPFIILGYRQLGLAFALRSIFAITLLSLCIWGVPYPNVTPDLLLTAVFGGFFIGAGIGLAVRGGAVLDGTEIVALLISRKFDLIKVGDVILVFNILLFLSAMAILGTEEALYSILTYFTAAKTLDFIIHGIDEYSAVIIVSAKSDQIRLALTQELSRGVTVYSGKGGLSDEQRDILYCVVTRLEIGKVNSMVRTFDSNAFIVVHPLSDVKGGTLKRAKLV